MPITLVTGPMFSGKTEYLISSVVDNTLIIKYKFDNRYSADNSLVSHSKQIVSKSDTVDIIQTDTIPPESLLKNYNLIIIDELQFFPFIEYLDKYPVIAALLNSDYNRKPFASASEYFAIAVEIIYCRGKCECGGYTAYNIRKDQYNNGEQILIGGDDIYVSVCHSCYYRK
jgi:thymidine kinase